MRTTGDPQRVCLDEKNHKKLTTKMEAKAPLNSLPRVLGCCSAVGRCSVPRGFRYRSVSNGLESFSDSFESFVGSFRIIFRPFSDDSTPQFKFHLARAGARAGPTVIPNRAVRPQPWPIESNWNLSNKKLTQKQKGTKKKRKSL